MIYRSKSALLAGALMLLTAAASAADPARVTLERKQQLVKQLLTQSPAVQRILQSDSVPAQNKLADAQSLYAKAGVEASAGHAEAALQLLDDSLRQISLASSMVPDIEQQSAKERSQNVHLREAIRTFQALRKTFASRMPAANVQSAEAMPGMGALDGMVVRADELMASGHQHDANVVLRKTYQSVVAALNTMLAAETIVYGAKFDSPADEFRHEMARNSSYEELIPIALAQLNATRDKASVAERYVQQSRDLRVAAQKPASNGDYATAIRTIHSATAHLQNALGIAGVVVPQSSEFTP